MSKVNISKTLAGKWLFLEESFTLLILDVVFRIIFRNISIFVFCALLWELLIKIGIDSPVVVWWFIAFSLSVGVWEIYRDFKLRPVRVNNLDTFRKIMRKYLEVDGFRIEKDNEKLMYAVRAKNRVHISDQFYAVYSKGFAFICPVYELPFPFSYILSNKLERSAHEAGRSS